jgi:hypothetical protein
MFGVARLNTLSKAAADATNAVSFDGTGDYYNSGTLSSSVNADSKYALVAITFYWNGGDNLQHLANVRLGTGSGDYGFWIWINGGRTQFKFVTGTGSNPGSIYENTENSLTTNAWNQLVMWVDTTSSTTSRIYVNGVSKAYSNDGFPTGGLFNWTNTATTVKIGQLNSSQTSTGVDFNGRVSQIYIGAATTDPGIGKFWDTVTGLPRDLGTTGTATALASPLIYHYGNTSTFAINQGTFASYTLTANGNLADVAGPTYTSAPTALTFSSITSFAAATSTTPSFTAAIGDIIVIFTTANNTTTSAAPPTLVTPSGYTVALDIATGTQAAAQRSNILYQIATTAGSRTVTLTNGTQGCGAVVLVYTPNAAATSVSFSAGTNQITTAVPTSQTLTFGTMTNLMVGIAFGSSSSSTTAGNQAQMLTVTGTPTRSINALLSTSLYGRLSTFEGSGFSGTSTVTHPSDFGTNTLISTVMTVA